MAPRAGQTPWSWLKPALTAWLGVGVVVAAVTLLWWSALPAVARAQALALWQAHGAMALALAVLTLPLAAWVAHRRWRQQHAWRHATLTEALRQSQAATQTLEQHVAQATQSLARDRRVLAALVAELTEGVVVCHASGEIMLYNQAACDVLRPVAQGPGARVWVGIGRLMGEVLNDPLLWTQATDHLLRAQQAGDARPQVMWVDGASGPAPPLMIRATLLDTGRDHSRLDTHGAATLVVLQPWPSRAAALAQWSAQAVAPIQAAALAAATRPWLVSQLGVEVVVQPAPDVMVRVPPLLWVQHAWDVLQCHLHAVGQALHWRWLPTNDTLGVQWCLGEAVLYQVELDVWRGETVTKAPGRGDALTADDERPEFFDFDIFQTSKPSQALVERPLAELSYTVFDLETTGLNPSEGDEIIEIGAVRVVNQRLRRHETLHQLVAPRRRVSASSQAVHGLTPAMLAGQPTLEQALPDLHSFARATVLVAHNAAFDMRFLELARARTGLHFDQPVLDTLLLSAVLHPEQGSHRLDAIAHRLELPVHDRHHALGDALLTAQVWLRLMPLLQAQGIVTLAQALQAARQSWQARLRY